jgi:hypothetical protein
MKRAILCGAVGADRTIFTVAVSSAVQLIKFGASMYYVSMNVCVYIYIYIYIYIHTQTFLYVRMCLCMYVCMYVKTAFPLVITVIIWE